VETCLLSLYASCRRQHPAHLHALQRAEFSTIALRLHLHWHNECQHSVRQQAANGHKELATFVASFFLYCWRCLSTGMSPLCGLVSSSTGAVVIRSVILVHPFTVPPLLLSTASCRKSMPWWCVNACITAFRVNVHRTFRFHARKIVSFLEKVAPRSQSSLLAHKVHLHSSSRLVHPKLEAAAVSSCPLPTYRGPLFSPLEACSEPLAFNPSFARASDTLSSRVASQSLD